jgi:hypothetical protein
MIPQVPLLPHVPEQQSLSCPQVWPALAQQEPPAQVPPQQSLFCEQLE